MPLDSSSYALALLRLDGRRWNELRRLHAQISTQAAADGSSYFEMGTTKVLCTVAGPVEGRRGGGGSGGGGGVGGLLTSSSSGGSGSGGGNNDAEVRVEISIAGFSGTDRKKRGRGDKRIAEMQSTVANACASNLFTHLYPRSIIAISLHVLSQDGSMLAACLNAATLALIDAGIPMSDYIVACTSGLIPSSSSSSSSSLSSETDQTDPILDLTGAEEQELPFLTVATLGASEKVSVLVFESRVQAAALQSMVAVAVHGCKQVREILDRVVRAHGEKRLLSSSSLSTAIGQQ